MNLPPVAKEVFTFFARVGVRAGLAGLHSALGDVEKVAEEGAKRIRDGKRKVKAYVDELFGPDEESD